MTVLLLKKTVQLSWEINHQKLKLCVVLQAPYKGLHTSFALPSQPGTTRYQAISSHDYNPVW